MKACIFIDGSNYYNSLKRNLGRTDVDLEAFANHLVGTRQLVRTYYYDVPLPSDWPEDQRRAKQRFHSAIQRVPYLELRLGKLVRREQNCDACGDVRTKYQEKGVDMRVGVDMVTGAAKNLYDVAILVSGDGDLVEAVQSAKDFGKHVEVATFPVGRSDDLAAAADVIRPLKVDEIKLLVRGA